MTGKQDRKWELKLWVDTTDYNIPEVLLKAQSFFDFWAYILHDKDVDENGEPVKAHYHFYGKTDRKLTLDGIAYQLQIPKHHIQFVKTWKGAIRYLTHIDYPDKHPYDLADAMSNFDLEAYFKAENEDEDMARQIFEFIRDHRGVSQMAVTEWVIEQRLWSAYRRGYAIFNTLIRENNEIERSDACDRGRYSAH